MSENYRLKPEMMNMYPDDKLPDQSWRAVTQMAEPDEVEGYLLDEIFKALGLQADGRWRRWFGPVLSPFVRSFARQAAEFDRCVAQHGLQQSAQLWLDRWIPGLNVYGDELVPASGPVLIAANHPGTFDGLAIASLVGRPDLKIVTAANPFFRALPNMRRYLIFSTLDTHVRMATTRNALRHLQDGCALLIFPSGKLDPDPLYFPEAARHALSRWSASLEFFLRKIPRTRLIVATNFGFVAPEYMDHPLARLRSSEIGRQKLAEFIQVIQQVVYQRRVSHPPCVMFSEGLALLPADQHFSSLQDQILAAAEKSLETSSSGCIG
jgi:hypothetical protein